MVQHDTQRTNAATLHCRFAIAPYCPLVAAISWQVPSGNCWCTCVPPSLLHLPEGFYFPKAVPPGSSDDSAYQRYRVHADTSGIHLQQN